jgi:hypothetical protein
MGDKTQLIALALTARFHRPWTIMLGTGLATVANHAPAASGGVWVSRVLPPAPVVWALAVSFIAFGIWTLVPDRAPEPGRRRRAGVPGDDHGGRVRSPGFIHSHPQVFPHPQPTHILWIVTIPTPSYRVRGRPRSQKAAC